MVKIGVIGLGWMGNIHCKLAKEIEDCKLVAVCDLDPEKVNRAQKEYGVKGYSDYRKLLEDPEVEAVYVVVPQKFHYQIVVDAIEASKHVLCEKPLALTQEEVNALREVVGSSDRKFIICFPARFAISSQEAKEIIESGAIGEVLYVRGNFRFTMKQHHEMHGEWVFDRKQGGGLILEASVHLWDFVRWITGKEVTRVLAVAHEYPVRDSVLEDNFAAVAYLDGRSIACIDMSSSFPPNSATDKRFEVIGSKGFIYIDEFRNYMTISSEIGVDANPGMLVKGLTHKDFMWHSHIAGGVRRLQEYFIKCIEKGLQPQPGVEDGARACEITWAVMKSLESGKLEEVKYGG